MRKLLAVTLSCLVIVACKKDEVSNTSSSEPDLTTVTAGTQPPPILSDTAQGTTTEQPPTISNTASSTDTTASSATSGLPDFGQPAQPQAPRYEYLTDTFYLWTPQQVQDVTDKVGSGAQFFTMANRDAIARWRRSQNWEPIRMFKVPGVSTSVSNPFINAEHHVVVYRRPVPTKSK